MPSLDNDLFIDDGIFGQAAVVIPAVLQQSAVVITMNPHGSTGPLNLPPVPKILLSAGGGPDASRPTRCLVSAILEFVIVVAII